jgi:hypothetical protein
MSTKKESLKFKVGELVRIDYSPELQRKNKLNEYQEARNMRPALILNVIEKELIGDFNKIQEPLFRYEVLVGREVIEIDQICIKKL